MNLKQYIENNYLRKNCELQELTDGYGWRLSFGGNMPNTETHMITEVHDDFIVVDDNSTTVPHLTIIPFACFTIVTWKKRR